MCHIKNGWETLIHYSYAIILSILHAKNQKISTLFITLLRKTNFQLKSSIVIYWKKIKTVDGWHDVNMTWKWKGFRSFALIDMLWKLIKSLKSRNFLIELVVVENKQISCMLRNFLIIRLKIDFHAWENILNKQRAVAFYDLYERNATSK